jgi:hypothetical protein
MSTSHAFSINEHHDVNQFGTLITQDLNDGNIGIVEAFSLIPNLTEFEFNAVDLNNDKKLNRSELHILSQYNS